MFAFFLGYVAKSKPRHLDEALHRHLNQGFDCPSPVDAFEFCPFNDGQTQIMRSLNVFESGKQMDLTSNLQGLLGEFVFLASDFVLPCCGDGRAFYSETIHGEICLVCDRCGALYDLLGRQAEKKNHRRMTKADFLKVFDEVTEEQWPYHEKVRSLAGV